MSAMDGRLSVDVSGDGEDELLIEFENSTIPCPGCSMRAVWISAPEQFERPAHVCLECGYGFEAEDGVVSETTARVDLAAQRIREQLAAR